MRCLSFVLCVCPSVCEQSDWGKLWKDFREISRSESRCTKKRRATFESSVGHCPQLTITALTRITVFEPGLNKLGFFNIKMGF